MAQPNFARAALQVGDVDFVDSRLLGEIDLPPAVLLAKLANAFSELNADARVHSLSIDLLPNPIQKRRCLSWRVSDEVRNSNNNWAELIEPILDNTPEKEKKTKYEAAHAWHTWPLLWVGYFADQCMRLTGIQPTDHLRANRPQAFGRAACQGNGLYLQM